MPVFAEGTPGRLQCHIFSYHPACSSDAKDDKTSAPDAKEAAEIAAPPAEAKRGEDDDDSDEEDDGDFKGGFSEDDDDVSASG